MAQGMFGAPVGLSARLHDDLKAESVANDTLGTMARMALLPAELRGKEASARLHEAQAAEKESDVAAMQQVMGGGVGLDDVPGDDLPAKLTNIGSRMLGTGSTGVMTKGKDLINLARQIRSTEATADFRKAQTWRNNVQAAQGEAQLWSGIAGSIPDGDQGAYNMGVMDAASKNLKVDDLPADVNMGLPILRQRAAASVTQWQRLQLGERQAAVDLAEKREQRQARQWNEGAPLRSAQQKLAEARRARIERGGGGAMARPGPNDLKATRKILEEVGIDIPKDGRDVAIEILASRAMEIAKASGDTMGRAQAVRQAIQEAQREGDLTQQEGGWSLFGVGPSAKWKYDKAGKTAEFPLPMPMQGSGNKRVPVLKDSDKGKYFLGPDGNTYFWNGERDPDGTPVGRRVQPRPGRGTGGLGFSGMIEGGGGSDMAEDDDDE